MSRWEKFVDDVEKKRKKNKADTKSFVKENFPFSKFFEDAPGTLFKEVSDVQVIREVHFNAIFQESLDEDFEAAELCLAHIKNLFDECKKCRPMEILRRGRDRGNFLVTRQAKV